VAGDERDGSTIGALEHVVRFYDDAGPGPLIADLVGGALAAGGSGIVIAAASEAPGIESAMGVRAVDADACRATNRLTTLDSSRTLGQITPDGVVDAAAFDATIGALVRRSVGRATPLAAT
jgi:hypothetical protein